MDGTRAHRLTRAWRAASVAVLFIAAMLAGSGVAFADNKQDGWNYHTSSTDCWQVYVEIRHPSIDPNFRQDMNVRNGRLNQWCSGSYRFSGGFTLRNKGELWSGNSLCGSFDVKNSNGVYGYAIGFPSNCQDLHAIGLAWAWVNGAWQGPGSASVTHS